MPPDGDDVKAMVAALFALIGGINRATRRSQGASTLSLLQVVAEHQQMRPSEIAELQHVHPSLITRQLRELEEMSYVDVCEDPADGRAWLVSLTAAGSKEVRRLQEIGLERFAAFVADWDSSEVRAFTTLIAKLEASKAAVAGEATLNRIATSSRARRSRRAGGRPQ